MKQSLNVRVAIIGLGVALTLFHPVGADAGSYGEVSSSGSSSEQIQREIARRQVDLIAAQKLIKEGDRAMDDEEYEVAYTKYLDAVDLIGSGPETGRQREIALARLSSASIKYAEWLVTQGRYGDAERVAKTVLLPQYNPTYKPAIVFLSHLEQQDYYNKTVTTKFAEDRDTVSKLLTEAEGFYQRGSLDLALKRYEQVLNLDKYNIAARKGMERVNVEQQKYAKTARDETRSRMLWQVVKTWERNPRRFDLGKTTLNETIRGAGRGTEAVSAKLNRLIIPSLDLRDTTIREAVDYLRQLSVQLDTAEPDPTKRGVNVFLKLSGAGAAPPPLPEPGLPAPAAPEGGLPAPEGAPAVVAAPAAPSVTASEDTRVTLSLTNVPLYEALRYVAEMTGLKIKIDPVAVSLVPLTEAGTDLITKEYKVPPSFLPPRQEAAAGGSPPPGGALFGGSVTAGEGPRIGNKLTAQEYLAQSNVEFPPGASAQYVAQGSRLIVRNTQDNIDVIDRIVDAIAGQAPTQVEIESKFVEINQNNLKELGFDWLLGPFAVGNGVYMSGGGSEAAPDPLNYPFVAPGASSPIGTRNITSGLRTGSGGSANSAISVSGVDALLGGLPVGAAPAILGLAGIYTNPQFQVVIRGLNQKKGVDLMSAPKVTTKSGAKATINIIREFRYPTEFEPPQIPQTTRNSDGVQIGGFQTNPIITPTTPSSFETKNTGVILDVEPIVGPDGYTIDLTLTPEVVDFEGFINYGTPILGLTSGSTAVAGIGIPGPPRSVVISPNVINQPVFSSRKVTTSVTIWDGMTVALGGLIREDVQKVQDKVPILGDIPLAGRLFRSDVDQRIKKNLIIFVTARLIDAEGKALRSTEDVEEVVESLGLPEELPPPQFPTKGPSTWK